MRSGAELVSRGGLILAHLGVDVSEWITGDGPDRIIIVANVTDPKRSRIAVEPGLSSDVYNSLEPGEAYRFEVKRSHWFDGPYYDLATATRTADG